MRRSISVALAVFTERLQERITIEHAFDDAIVVVTTHGCEMVHQNLNCLRLARPRLAYLE